MRSKQFGTILMGAIILFMITIPIQPTSASNTIYESWTWHPIELVSPESSSDSQDIDIIYDQYNNLHVVWRDTTDYNGTGTDSDIFYKRRNATTSMWSAAEVVSTGSNLDSHSPRLALDGDNSIFIVWEDSTEYNDSGPDRDIFLRKQDATARDWGPIELVSNMSTTISFGGTIAVDSQGNAHVVWFDKTDFMGAGGSDYDIFLRTRFASNSSWGSTLLVSSNSFADSLYPEVGTDSQDTVHIVWQDLSPVLFSGTDTDIFHITWSTIDQSFGTYELVSDFSNGYSAYPALEIVGDEVHVVWEESVDPPGPDVDIDIFYNHREAPLTTYTYDNLWHTMELVSIKGVDTSNPKLAVDPYGSVHVVWEMENTTNYHHIYYSHKVMSSWTIHQRLSPLGGNSKFDPNIAINSYGYVNVVWLDYSDYQGAGSSDLDLFSRVLAGPPPAPILDIIGPKLRLDGQVRLVWDVSVADTTYNVYRETSPITSTSGLTPVTSLPHAANSYQEELSQSGEYYYAVTTENPQGESIPSNNLLVEVNLEGIVITETQTVVQEGQIITQDRTMTQNVTSSITVTREGTSSSLSISTLMLVPVLLIPFTRRLRK